MRWFWVDRFIEFNSGRSARAIKNVTLAEEHLHDHFPGFPVMPASLILEGMAQTGGILLGETHNFDHIVVLAKVPRVEFHSWACPGDTLTYEATLLEARDEGGMVSVTARCEERLVAEAEIMFAHLEQSVAGDVPEGASQKNFVFDLGGLLGILDVGKAGTAPAGSTPAE